MSESATPRDRDTSTAEPPRYHGGGGGGTTPPSSARRSARPFSSRGGQAFGSTLARTPRTPRVSSEPLHVAIKIRPPPAPEAGGDVRETLEHRIVDGNQFMLVCPPNSDMGQEETRTYEFGNIFGPDASDDCLPNLVVPKVLEQLRLGYNSTLLCYGQTGSGKTHSISQLLPKCIESVFQTIEADEESQDITYIVEMSFLQIYNGNVFNLLPAAGSSSHSNSAGRMSSSSHAQGSSSKRSGTPSGGDAGEALPKPKGPLLVPEPCVVVNSAAQALSSWHDGQKKRVTSAHAMNLKSSRSHCLLSLHVAKLLDGTPIQGSKITLVDLAGSERLKKTEVEAKDQKQEAISINSSLTALQRTIKELAEGNPNPPYRDNVLTMYLAQSLSDACNIIIANVSIEPSNLSETKSTLEFATVAKKCVVTRSKANQRIAGKQGNFEATWEQLRLEIVCLRNKLEVLQQEADLERQRNRMLQQQSSLQMQLDGSVSGLSALGGVSSHTSGCGTSGTPIGGNQLQQHSTPSIESDKVAHRICDLEKQATSFTMLLREKEDELRQLDSKRDDAESLAKELQDRLIAMDEARELLHAELQGRTAEEKEQYSLLQSKFEKLNESFMWQDERYNEAVENNRVAQLNLENLQKTTRRQHNELHAAHVNALKWEEQLAAMRNELSEVNEAKAKIQASYDDLEFQVEREKTQALMQAQAARFDAKGEATRRGELRELQEAIEDQKAVHAALSERAKVAEETVLELQKDHMAAEQRANAAEQAYRNFDRRSSFSDRRQMAGGFTGSEPKAQGISPYEIATLKKQLGAVTAEKAGLMEKLKSRDHQSAELNQKLEELTAELEHVKQDNNCLRQLEEVHTLEGDDFERRLEQVYEELEANVTERENLEKQLEEKRKNVQTVETEFRQSVMEIEKLQTELEGLNFRLRTYENTHEELSARLRVVSDEAGHAERGRKAEHEKVKELMIKLKELEVESEEQYATMQAGQHHQSMLTSMIANRRRSEKHILTRLGDANQRGGAGAAGGSRALAEGRHQKTAARVNVHHNREGSSAGAEPAYIRLSKDTSNKHSTSEQSSSTATESQIQLVSQRFARGTRSNKIKESFSHMAHNVAKREGEAAAAAAVYQQREPAVTFHQFTAVSPNNSTAGTPMSITPKTGGGVGGSGKSATKVTALPLSTAIHGLSGIGGATTSHQRSASNTSGSLQTPREMLKTPREKACASLESTWPNGSNTLSSSTTRSGGGSSAGGGQPSIKFKTTSTSIHLNPNSNWGSNNKPSSGRGGTVVNNRASEIQMRARQEQQQQQINKPVTRTPAVPTLALAKQRAAN